jgi:alkyldihydroxyacetonephosphate synthase
MTRPTMPNAYPDGRFEGPVPAPLDKLVLDELDAMGVAFDVSDAGRADHGRDWWPLTIRDVANATVPHWPSVVVRPTSTEQVSGVLELASRHLIALTAQGGRSGVVGGAVAPDGGIALDLTGLDRILGVDTMSGTVTTEAGVFGPDLERHVQGLGWTVGHFPQSFDLATVGGWIACRGAGQYSNRYGKIEDIVRALTVVLANGEIIRIGGRGPRQAVGPDLLQLFTGSEGTLGVITEATLVMHPRAVFEQRAAYLFASFTDGLTACRRILQRDARPAVLRLYDEVESQRNFELDGCALIVLDEGDPLLVKASMSIVAEECAAANVLDDSPVATWLAHRNNVDALAPLWTNGFVVDTIEVAGPWSTLAPMHERVSAALGAVPEMMVASVHQSHAYLDGACLYFTFAGRPTGDATAFYRAAWDAATDAVLSSGGALSHHHGVGRNRARYVARALDTAFPVLDAIKSLLDPHDILNPGALGLGGATW